MRSPSAWRCPAPGRRARGGPGRERRGSSATNTIDDTIAAYIGDKNSTTIVHANGGGLTLTASDDATIRANAGSGGLAIAASTGSGAAVAASIGAGLSINSVGANSGESIMAYIVNATATAAGDVMLDATSTATIDALAIGVAGAARARRGRG